MQITQKLLNLENISLFFLNALLFYNSLHCKMHVFDWFPGSENCLLKQLFSHRCKNLNKMLVIYLLRWWRNFLLKFWRSQRFENWFRLVLGYLSYSDKSSSNTLRRMFLQTHSSFWNLQEKIFPQKYLDNHLQKHII